MSEVLSEIGATVLTGGFDKPYALGLLNSLALRGVRLDVVGSDELDIPELRNSSRIRFLNLHGKSGREASLYLRLSKVLLLYAKLIAHIYGSTPKIIHILWNNKLQVIDRTLLMGYYKLLGKKIALTAHNINAARRDSKDSFLNRFSLRIQYRVADHIFVHTDKMKAELLEDFGVRDRAVTVIPFGINNTVPDTGLTSEQAKERLGVATSNRTILFFGNIGSYKGLEFLVTAFQSIANSNPDYRLVIAGKARGDGNAYLREVQRAIGSHSSGKRVLQNIGFVPDEDIELYFKAADVLVLPYTHVSQSGVLFLAYNFGLPVIASRVGSFTEDIIDGETGLLCEPGDPPDLARAIEKYFVSDMYKHLEGRRQEIRNQANAKNSWAVVGEMTCKVYTKMLGGELS